MKQISPANSLTVCIVAHNEAANIARAIRSVAGWGGEIMVLDCDSRDDTAEIARREGAEVHRGPNNVPEANKNRCMDLARLEWIFILDADETATEELKDEIAATIARNPAENGFRMPRRNFYFGVPLMHGGNYPDRQLRLLRRGKGRYPGVGIHESMIMEGEVGLLTSPFDHHPYPTLDLWFGKFDYYTRSEAAEFALRGVPITPATIRHHMITRPLRRWIERLILKRGYRDGVPGILAATFDLMTKIVGFGRYWEASKKKEIG